MIREVPVIMGSFLGGYGAWLLLLFVNILLYPAACETSTVVSAKPACVQPGIHGACIKLSILNMFCVKQSACFSPA